MNAKKAKQLRKLVRQMAAITQKPGEPNATYTENETRRKFAEFEVEVKDEETGAPVKQKQRLAISAGTVSLNPKSSRGFYKMLKKSMGETPSQAAKNITKAVGPTNDSNPDKKVTEVLNEEIFAGELAKAEAVTAPEAATVAA